MDELLSFARAKLLDHALTIVVGVVVGSVGEFVNDLPLAFTLTLVVGSVASVIWARVGWARLRELRFRPANFEKWDRVDHPALWQVACLWDGYEPYTPVNETTPSYATLQMLKSAIIQLELTPYEFGKGDIWVRVQRDELRAYVEKRGDRPLFLFPEDRLRSDRK